MDAHNDWVGKAREQAKVVSVDALVPVLKKALADIEELQRSIARQEPVLREMLADCEFILEGRKVASSSDHPPGTRRTARSSRQRGEVVRKTILELVGQGKQIISIGDIVEALVSRGLEEYRDPSRSGSLGTVLHWMPQFKRLPSGDFEYVGLNGNQPDLWQPTGDDRQPD